MACSFFPALFTSLFRFVVIRRDQRFRVLKRGGQEMRGLCGLCSMGRAGEGRRGRVFFVLRGCLGDEEVGFDLFITDLFSRRAFAGVSRSLLLSFGHTISVPFLCADVYFLSIATFF